MRQRDKQAPQRAEETVGHSRRATRRHFSAADKIRVCRLMRCPVPPPPSCSMLFHPKKVTATKTPTNSMTVPDRSFRQRSSRSITASI